MPVDSKRNPRPDNSIPYFELYEDDDTEASSKKEERTGGRNNDELRPMYLRLGTTRHAQGSCYLELGSTKVTAAVYGPREMVRRAEFSSTSGQLGCELKFAPFAGRRRKGYMPDDRERELSQTLKTALEPAVCLHEFPKSHVDVFVYVLEDDGGALAAAVVAAGAALADAAVPMYGLVTAAALRHQSGTDLLDPDSGDLDPLRSSGDSGDQYGDVTLGYMPQLQQVTCLYSDGMMSVVAMETAMKSLTDACGQVYGVLKEKLLTKAKEDRPMQNGSV